MYAEDELFLFYCMFTPFISNPPLRLPNVGKREGTSEDKCFIYNNCTSTLCRNIQSCSNCNWLNRRKGYLLPTTANTFVWVNNDMIIGWCMHCTRTAPVQRIKHRLQSWIKERTKQKKTVIIIKKWKSTNKNPMHLVQMVKNKQKKIKIEERKR